MTSDGFSGSRTPLLNGYTSVEAAISEESGDIEWKGCNVVEMAVSRALSEEIVLLLRAEQQTFHAESV